MSTELAWRRICCPVDFSEASQAALAQAAAVANRLGAELMVVHVRRATGTGGATPFAPPDHAQAVADTSRQLADYLAEARRTVPVTTSVELRGAPADEIVRFAQEFSCDLIVMGTHSRTGLRRAALGSVAEHVIRAAPCPVLVVRSG